MKYFFSCVLIFLLAAALEGCRIVTGNGSVVSQTQGTDAFHAVCVNGDFLVTLEGGAKNHQVTISSDKNLLPYIKTDVQGDTLNIYTVPRVSLSPSQPIKITILMKNLYYFSTSGSIKAKISQVKAPSLDLKTSGSTEINFSGKAKTINLVTSGSNKMDLSGQVNQFNIRSSGNNKISAQNLSAENVEMNSNGSNQITVNVKKLLTANISGSGKIGYIGHPKIKQNISGSVTLQNLDGDDIH